MRALLVETWHDTYDPLLGAERVTEITDAWHAATVLGEQFANPANVFLIAEAAGRIVGHAFAHEQPGEVLSVARLYVLPSHQRFGIGALLLTAAIRGYRHIRRVRLSVEAENAKGLAFYRRQHFTVVGEAVEGDIRVLRMERVVR